MAICTRLGSGSVEQDLLSIDVAEQFVTSRACDVAVLSLQGECRASVVIKQGRLPLGRIVAVAALGHLVGVELDELPSVHIFVAVFTLFWRLLEVHVNQLGLEVRRFVAVDAGYCAVRSSQRERRGVVVESVQFFPGLSGVTRLAAHRLSVLADLVHALFELALVHVLVAGRAGEIVEVIRDLRFRLRLVGELVAIGAGNGDVPSGELELGLFMLRERERRRTVALERVALVALVVVRLAHELRVVLVHVAIRATFEVHDLENRVLALGRVTLVALHLSCPSMSG